MILFLDDNPARHNLMESRFPGEIIHIYNIDSFSEALEKYESFDEIYLDYDLNEFADRSLFLGDLATGLDACGYMIKFMAKLPPIIQIHSANPTGAKLMVNFFESKNIVCRWKMFDDTECYDD